MPAPAAGSAGAAAAGVAAAGAAAGSGVLGLAKAALIAGTIAATTVGAAAVMMPGDTTTGTPVGMIYAANAGMTGLGGAVSNASGVGGGDTSGGTVTSGASGAGSSGAGSPGEGATGDTGHQADSAPLGGTGTGTQTPGGMGPAGGTAAGDTPVAVPEPGTLFLFAFGAVAAFVARQRSLARGDRPAPKRWRR